MGRYKFIITITVMLTMFMASGVVVSDNYSLCKCYYQDFAIRRARDINSQLVPGRYYTFEELAQRGFKTEEIKIRTLDGYGISIVKPENISQYGCCLICLERKEDRFFDGYLLNGIFLDSAELKKKYEQLIEEYARVNNVLADGNLDKDTLGKLDLLRHDIHLQANLLGRVLNKDRNQVMIDILDKRIELFGIEGWSNEERDLFHISLQEGGDIALTHNWVLEEVVGFHDDGSRGRWTWFSNTGVIFRALNAYFNHLFQPGVFSFSEMIGEDTVPLSVKMEPIGSSLRTDAHREIVSAITFPKVMFPLVVKQIKFLLSREISNTSYFSNYYGYDFEDREEYYEKELGKVNWQAEIGAIIFGNKGYSLLNMEANNVSVPEFIILTGFSNIMIKEGQINKKRILDETEELGISYATTALSRLGKFCNKSFPELIFSVRSSPSVSMPGMLSTVLNVGINEEGVKLLADRYGERFAYETYAIFLRSFGSSVFGINDDDFNSIPFTQSVRETAERYKRLIEERGFEVPQDLKEQLTMAVKAVQDSWNSEQAKQYRADRGIPDDLDMVVIIQQMKFGNLNENSGSFVLFTRHPITGEKGIYLNYARQSQGVDIVSGRVTPVSLAESGLSEEIVAELRELAAKIEGEFSYIQDIEGVIEDGKIWILQSRDAILSPEAEARALVEMVEDGVITKEELFRRVDLDKLGERLNHPYIDPQINIEPIISGQPASTGAVSGVIAFDLESVQRYKEQGLNVILVKREFDPFHHIAELKLSDGLLIQVGGNLSHGAIQGRAHDVPTIVGVAIEIDRENNTLTIGDKVYKEGDHITLDGTEGLVYEGQIPLIEPKEVNPYLEILKKWQEELR